MYAVTGATGNVGRGVAQALLAQGKKVRVIGRNTERLQPLVGKGADAFVGSLDDASAMTRAFSGVTAAIIITPPNLHEQDYPAFQKNVGEALTAAIRGSDIRHIVNISSIGADTPKNSGPVNGLYGNEQRLNELEGVAILHARPTYFMENIFFSLDPIKNMDMVVGTLDGDIKVPMIATRDVAAFVAKPLLSLDFSGISTVDILGAADISMQQVTKAIGTAVGKEFTYMQAPYDAAEKAMTEAGLSVGSARLMNELHRGINEGTHRPTEPRTTQNTTPTSINDFAREVFATVYNA